MWKFKISSSIFSYGSCLWLRYLSYGLSWVDSISFEIIFNFKLNICLGRFLGLFFNLNILNIGMGYNISNKFLLNRFLINRLLSIWFRFIILSLSCFYLVIFVMLYDFWLRFFLRFLLWLNFWFFFFVLCLCNVLFMNGEWLSGFFFLFSG